MSSAPVLHLVADGPRSGRIAVDDVIVGERARRDLGDLTDLMESIETIGLIQAISLAPGNQLLCGARRLEAFKRLGRSEIAFVRPLDREDAATLLRAERDENTCRKEMTASEVVSLGRRLEELERPAAKERQRESGRAYGRGINRSGSTDPNLSAGADSIATRARTNDVVSDALGVSASTYKRYKTIVTAAESDPDPAIRNLAEEQLRDLDAGRTSASVAAIKISDARRSNTIDESDPLIDSPAASAPDVDSEPAVQPEPAPAKKSGPRPNHLKILDRVTAGLTGTAIALDDIHELNDTVNAEEARRLMSDLSKSIRSLNRIKSLLKERTNG